MSDPVTGHAVIILAAGAAARMGRPKQLLEYGGVPLVRHAALTAIQSGARVVVAVLGARAGEVSAALLGVPALVVLNERWRDGMGGSIHAGLRVAESAGASSVTVMLADQPLISGQTLRDLAHRREAEDAPVVAAAYAGTSGVPAVFGKQVFADLYALPPGEGCKSVIRAHHSRAVLVNCPEAAIDVDTPADYARIIGLTV